MKPHSRSEVRILCESCSATAWITIVIDLTCTLCCLITTLIAEEEAVQRPVASRKEHKRQYRQILDTIEVENELDLKIIKVLRQELRKLVSEDLNSAEQCKTTGFFEQHSPLAK